MALIDITVKTLDGQNRSFSVPEQMTVRSFKEKISNSIEIPADTQRLIFHGRVMQDDKELREYDIHGKAVHVVQRAPPSSTSTTTDGGSTSQPSPHHHHHHHHPSGFVGPDGNLVDVQIHFGGMNTASTSRDARRRIQQAEINVGIINDALDLLEQRIGIQGSQSGEERAGRTRGTQQEDMDTSTPTSSSQRETTSTTAASTATTTSTGPSISGQPRSRDSSTSRSQGPEGLSATDLADFLDRVLVTSRRMEPHLIRYRDYLTEDQTYTPSSQEARNAQEVANRVMEAVHAMSHVMHSLSDVMVDMHSPSPRQGMAVPVSPLFGMSPPNTMAIPIHMNLRARASDRNGNGRGRGRAGNPTNTQTATSEPATSTSNTQTATSTSNTQTGVVAGEAADAGQNTSPLVVEGIQVGEPIVTVHNIQAAVVTDDDNILFGEGGGGGGGIQFDTSGMPGASISIVSTNQNPAGNNASSSTPSAPNTASTTTSSNSATSNTTTTTGTSRTTAATAGFTMGPTTNVNIGGTGSGLAALPNVPGLPGGMLQNIVQSILNNHGVQAGQPVQVNVVHPGGVAGGIHVQPQGSSQTRPSGANTASPAGTPTPPGINNMGRPTGNIRPILINRGRPTPYPLGPRQAQPRPQGTVGSTTTTNSTSGGGPQPPPPQQGGHHHHHHHGNRGFVDTALPCGSHHYLSQTARRAARNNRTQGQQQVPNLSTMVSGMVGDLIGQVGGHVHHHTARNNNGGNRMTATSSSATAATTATTSSSSNPQPNTTTSSGGPSMPGMPAGFNPMQMLAGLFGGPGGLQGGPGGPPGAPIHLDLTSVLASMMGGNVNPPAGTRNASTNPGSSSSSSSSSTAVPPAPPAQSSSSTSGGGGAGMMSGGGTLADLFQHFNNQMGANDSNEPSDASFVQSLIETVAPHIRLTDLFSLVMGNTRVIGQLRQPLRQFAEGRVTQLGSVENVVSAALDDMNPEIVFVTGCVEVRPGIDMTQSLRACVRHHLTVIIQAILSETPANQDVYSQELFNLWMSALSQVIAVSVYCIQDGEEGFGRMLQQYMPRLTRDLSADIGFWMSTSVQDILSSFHHNHPVSQEEILAFVVNANSASQSVEATATSTSNPATDESANATATTSSDPVKSYNKASTTVDAASTGPVVPMEVTESPSDLPPRPKVQRQQQRTKDTNNDSGDEFVDAPEEFTSRPPAVPRPSQIATSSSSPLLSTMTTTTDRLSNGEACGQWQDMIPQDWIPVIQQDVERQREQRSQPALSDAYLQGLPAKRRRMMVLEHAGEMGNMPHYLPSAISRAAQAAGVEPISSHHNLMQEAREEKELQDSLEQEVQAIVESRISSDQDFNSDRFPNSIRYFQKPPTK